MTPSEHSKQRGREGRDYTYEVVTSNGAGVHGRGYRRCSTARAAMKRLAALWTLPGEAFEIQRVEHIENGRRYEMRQRSRWVQWDPHRDHTVRRPDWLAMSGESS